MPKRKVKPKPKPENNLPVKASDLITAWLNPTDTMRSQYNRSGAMITILQWLGFEQVRLLDDNISSQIVWYKGKVALARSDKSIEEIAKDLLQRIA